MGQVAILNITNRDLHGIASIVVSLPVRADELSMVSFVQFCAFDGIG